MLIPNFPYEPLVIYSGYANSRKTFTVNPVLKEMGYTVLSTSQVLDRAVELFFQAFFGKTFDSQDKDAHYQFTMTKNPTPKCRVYTNSPLLSRRDLKIKYAEEMLVAQFGRQIFASQVGRNAMGYLSMGNPVAIETVGGDEMFEMMKTIEARYLNCMATFNARHENEIAGVDLRQLIPSTADFDTDCYDSFKYELGEYLRR